MLKLYKRIDGVLHYHEAWASGREIIEHWGPVGERGDAKKHKIPKKADEDELIEQILKPARAAGYAEIVEGGEAVLLIEYAIDGFGTKKDLKKRHALEDRMNETLGWVGLGNCDGGSTGSGTMEVCCFVVDFDIAKRVIEADLAGTKFANFTRIYREDIDE
ncbi:MAG: hypothetical protein U0791_17055 [Gemmataceae bacterium]